MSEQEYVGPDEFKAWPKIPRAKANNVTITEKMDGTNACISIYDGKIQAVQSRKRLITPDNDNYGFAGWVERNAEELVKLGDGRHYGEWAGAGIQSNPHELDMKYFYLFNVLRPRESLPEIEPHVGTQTGGVRMVQELYTGPYSDEILETCFLNLLQSAKEQGYTPEGIIVYYHLFKHMVKLTYANADGKWRNA